MVFCQDKYDVNSIKDLSYSNSKKSKQIGIVRKKNMKLDKNPNLL